MGGNGRTNLGCENDPQSFMINMFVSVKGELKKRHHLGPRTQYSGGPQAGLVRHGIQETQPNNAQYRTDYDRYEGRKGADRRV
jgi:hypothetical protein